MTGKGMGLSYKMEGLFYLRKHLGTQTKSAKCPKSSPSLQSASSPLILTRTKKIFPHPPSLPLSLPSLKNPPMLQPPYSSTRTFCLRNLTPFTFQILSATSTEPFPTTPVTANMLPTALESGPQTPFSPNSILPTATIDWWDLRLSNSPTQSRLSNKPSKTYRNQTKSNNKTLNNSYPEWNPAGLETKSNKPFSDNIAPINLGSPNQRKPHPHLPPLRSLLPQSVPECPYQTSSPPNPPTTHNAVTLVTVPLTSERNAPKPLVSSIRAPCRNISLQTVLKKPRRRTRNLTRNSKQCAPSADSHSNMTMWPGPEAFPTATPADVTKPPRKKSLPNPISTTPDTTISTEMKTAI